RSRPPHQASVRSRPRARRQRWNRSRSRRPPARHRSRPRLCRRKPRHRHRSHRLPHHRHRRQSRVPSPRPLVLTAFPAGATLRSMRTLLLLAAFLPAARAQQPAPPPPAATNPAAKPPQNSSSQPPIAPPSAAPTMSPAAAYDYAMQPFTNARFSPNDLTEADQWALGIGVARARQSCEAVMKEKLHGEDLLALGKL